MIATAHIEPQTAIKNHRQQLFSQFSHWNYASDFIFISNQFTVPFQVCCGWTEVRIFFLKGGGQSLHRNVRFFHPHRPRHKSRLNDHTSPPRCFVASMLLSPLCCFLFWWRMRWCDTGGWCYILSMVLPDWVFFPLHIKACLRCVLAGFSPGRLYRNLAPYWTKLNWESVPFTDTRMNEFTVTFIRQ